jgi:hypothetical protein
MLVLALVLVLTPCPTVRAGEQLANDAPPKMPTEVGTPTIGTIRRIPMMHGGGSTMSTGVSRGTARSAAIYLLERLTS